MSIKVDFFERLEGYAQARPMDMAIQGLSDQHRVIISWQKLAEEIRGLGARLSERLRKRSGVHVAILMEDSPHWAITFLSAWSAGCIIVPLDPSRDAASLAGITTHADCELLLTSPKYAEAAAAIAALHPGLSLMDSMEPRPSASGPLPLLRRDPFSDIAILYTGGTTGAPKGVRLTEANLFYTIWDTLEVIHLSQSDHVLSILPLFHVMALLANMLGPLYVGGKVTYLEAKDPARILATFAQEKVTAFLCVPQFFYLMVRRIFEQVETLPPAKKFVFYRLLKLSRFLRMRFGIKIGRKVFGQIHERFGPQFRMFAVGAASFASATGDTLHDLGFDMFQAYGMTETTGPATIDPLGPEGGTTCGKPLSHSRIRIHEPNEEGIGEVLMAGEHLTPGYWKDEKATAALIHDGWLWSGDLGYIDPRGRLRVTGRKKEVIVLSSGKNIFPEQVEYQLQKASEYIKELCVLGHVGEDTEERLHAVVVPDFDRLRERGVTNAEDQIRFDIDSASRVMPEWQRVKSLEIREEPLPRTSTRKLKRFEVKPRFQNSTKAAPTVVEAPTGPEPEVYALIRRIKRNAGHITPGTSLELDLGLGSLERVELLSNIQAAYGIQITTEQAGRLQTAGDLAALVESIGRSQGQAWMSWDAILQAPLTAREQEIAQQYLTRRPLMDALIFLICRLFRLIAGLLFSFRVTGSKHVPLDGPFLLCANHASYLDALFLAASLPYPAFRKIFFLGATKYTRKSFQRWFARMIHGVAVDAGANAGSGLRMAAEGLDRGLVLCVFPEGHRSVDGNLLPFHHGPSIVATQKNLPILPVGITGTHEVWGRGSSRIRLHPVEVRIGPKIDPPDGEGHEQMTAEVERAIRALLEDAPVRYT